jgi:hypothetical protein
MAETGIEQTPDLVDPAAARSAETKAASQTPDTNGVTGSEHDVLTKGVTRFAPHYLADALNDAERLLKYAAETGVEIGANIRNYILDARFASSSGWTQEKAANLLTALTELAVRVRPVTAESLRSYFGDSRRTVRFYTSVAIPLAIIIVLLAAFSFVASAISSAIRTDIATANDLVVKLRVQLGPLPTTTQEAATAATVGASPTPKSGTSENDVIKDLVDFASTNREIYARAQQLNLLVPWVRDDPFADIRGKRESMRSTFELTPGLPNPEKDAVRLAPTYQDVRHFALRILDDVSFWYGALTTCILPVFYALLGTLAYLLRSFEQQMSTRTFIPSEADTARFLIAAIGGAVVGLFSNFNITQGGAVIPPLAIAFLVGYAVDVFFAFLDGLLQTFTRSSPGSPTPPQAEVRPSVPSPK